MSDREKPKKTAKTSRAVIDASDLILGRLASNVAKRILAGEEVIVVNAENVIISGNKRYIVETYKKHLETRTLGSQKKAPKHPRRPDTYVRRVVRGMIPWKKPQGKIAYRRLKVYVGLPENLKAIPTQLPPEAKKSVQSFVTVGELMETFGWKRS